MDFFEKYLIKRKSKGKEFVSYFKKDYKRFRFGLSVFYLFILLFATSFAQGNTYLSDTVGRSIIIDAHIHNGFSINDKIILHNPEYFRSKKVNAFLFPLPVDYSKTENLLARIEDEITQIRMLSKKSGEFSIIESFNTGETTFIEKETKVVFGIEYFYGIFDNNSESVERYYKLGIRFITMHNSEADRLFDESELTFLGKELIKRMNEFGILIDITHLNDDRKVMVVDYSKSPVMASHSLSRNVAENDFNLSDDALRALKEKRGYVFLSFNKNDLYYRGKEDKDAIEKYLDHVDYLKNFLGEDYIGFGSDYQADGKYVPAALNKTGTYLNILNGLRSRGYTETQIRKFSSENVLNALGLK